MTSRLRAIARKTLPNKHFWIILAILVILSILHYSSPVGGIIPYNSLHLTRHTVDRVLLLIPIVYSIIVFGVPGGITCLVASLAIMVPHVIIYNDSRIDASLEVFGVTLVGALLLGWYWAVIRERRRGLRTIAELEKSQRALKLDDERLAALNKISSIISRLTNVQEALDKALEEIMRVMNLEIAMIFILSKDETELELTAFSGVQPDFAEGVKHLKVGEGLNGLVAHSGEPLVLEDAGHDPRLTREVVAKERLMAQLIVPVKSRDKVVGTLAVGTRRSRRFTQEEIAMISAIGDELGVAIENGRLYSEQLSMSERLKQSERNYRELFEKAQDAIWVHDIEGNILNANAAASQLTGYRLDELYQLNVKRLLDDEGLTTSKEIRRKLLSGETFHQPYEQTLIRRDGSEASLMLTTSVITHDGKIRGFQHIARDVTEQKRLTENLRFYVQQITRAQEEERKRIARELHDDTAQALVVLSRQLDKLLSAKPKIMDDVTPLEKLSDQVESILDGVRRFSQDLRPSILDDLGLIPALEWLASDLTEHFGISVGVEAIGLERRFPPEVELLYFRIAQEALRNVWRHSGASRAWVTIEFTDKKTILTVKDNGRGFKPPERLNDLTVAAKLGLAGMAERARLLNGDLKITSEIDKGTTVSLEVAV